MKRILSLFIATILLFSSMTCVTATSDYERELLSALSIMQGDANGSMRYEDKVSRAECAKIIVAISQYRDTLSKDIKSSPFKDVLYTHWASPYITVGIKNGLFKGYLDATFRPSNTILYEEAITMFLRVLGYSDEDFGTDWPHDQIEVAKNIGLLNNISNSIGQELTRRNISKMAYNTLMSKAKNATNAYLTNFNRIIGPKTVTSSVWHEEYSTDKPLIVVRDGVRTEMSSVQINDILYYMEEYNTVLTYSKKITGIYEDAVPNKEAPTSVIVSGVTYNIEGVDALSKLSSGGSYNYGDTITLLLGKNGDVADVLTNEQLSEKVYGFLTAAGTKQTIVSGSSVTKPYAEIVLPSGETREYIAVKDYSSLINSAVCVTFKDGIATISANVSNDGISGNLVWNDSTRSIGKNPLSENVQIIEVSTVQNYETAKVAKVFPQRLNGTTLGTTDILYASKNSSGAVDKLILYDITGDIYSYGVMIKAKNNNVGFSVSGSYEYISDGVTSSLVTNGTSYNVTSGEVFRFITDGRSISSLSAINKVATGKITDITGSLITLGGKTYTMSDKVQIYQKKSYEYTSLTKDELNVLKDDCTASIYQDMQGSKNSRIRVIIIS